MFEKKSTVGTELRPRELTVKLAWALDTIHKDAVGHDKAKAFDKPNWDKKAFGDLELFISAVRKLEDSWARGFYGDAKLLNEVAQKNPTVAKGVEKYLDKIEDILEDMRKGEYQDMRKGNFLRRLAHHLKGEVKKVGKQVHRFEEQFEKSFKHERIKKRLLIAAKKSKNN